MAQKSTEKSSFRLVRRRAFIAGLGALSALPRPMRAQSSALPRIGFLNGYSPVAASLTAFRQGLREAGYVEGSNVIIEYRWAEGHAERLYDLAAELARVNVSVIVTSGGDPVIEAAKQVTKAIPIIALFGGDPVRNGLVASFNRPGGNITGVTLFGLEQEPKRLELLHELVPGARQVGYLIDDAPTDWEEAVDAVQAAAEKLSLALTVIKVHDDEGLAPAFSAAIDHHIAALLVSDFPLFNTGQMRKHIVELCAQYSVPSVSFWRAMTEAGALMSYGTSSPGLYHQLGNYAGRILKGDEPADLPVQQPATFELVINAKTAKTLGLTIPTTLLATADEVIE